MRKSQKFLVFLLLLLILPAVVFAVDPPPGSGLVPCPGGRECDFNQLMELVANVINFILTKLVVPIAAIMFAYAGVQLVFAGGNTEAIGTAKKILLNTVLGLVFAFAAWLIVHLILTTLGWNGSWIGF